MEMKYAEILAKIEELKSQAEEAKRNETKEIILKIKEQIKLYNLTADDLGLTLSHTPKQKTKNENQKKVMYRNGDLTWSGSSRGRTPQWIIDLKNNGEDIEKYRVA